MLPWYYYVDEALHRILAPLGYGTGWRFCDWVERRYQRQYEEHEGEHRGDNS